MRRATIGAAQVEGLDISRTPRGKLEIDLDSIAMIEYSLDLDLPDEVFENPIIKAMSDATNDLMTWPNVCVHFLFDATVTDFL